MTTPMQHRQRYAEVQLGDVLEGLPEPRPARWTSVEPSSVPLLYLACPYTKGDPCINTNVACRVARLLEEATGAVVINPLVTHWEHTFHPRHYEDWLFRDFRIILACDAVVRLAGDSAGANRECAFAAANNIPVLYLHHTEDSASEVIQAIQNLQPRKETAS